MVVTKNVNDLDVETRKAIRDKAVSSGMTADEVKTQLNKVGVTETNPVVPIKQTIQDTTPLEDKPQIKTDLKTGKDVTTPTKKPEVGGAGIIGPSETPTSPTPSTTIKIDAKKEEPTKVTETPPAGLPQSIEDWKKQGSNISDLASMIETQNNTTVTNENGVLKGNIDGVDYQWIIDDAGNPIKTRVGGENVQDIFTQLQAGIELPDTGIKTTPEYQKAEKRFNNYSLYKNLTPEEFGVSLAEGLIIPGTQLYKDLSSNPEIKIKLDKAASLNKINDKSTDIINAGENLTEIVLSDPTISNYMSDNNISAEEFNNLTTTPETIAKGKEVEALGLKVNDLKATYESIRKETEAQFKGTGASRIEIESLIARRQADIRPALNLAIDNYNTVFGTYTDMKQTAIDLFKTNLGLYQQAQEEQAKQQAVLDQRAYEQANKGVPTSMIQVGDKQQLINSQTGELIKEYDLATGTATGTSDWAKLDDTTLYNKSTGETKSVTKQEANQYAGITTVTAGTTQNRPDRNNNPGNVKLAPGQSIDDIIGGVGQDDQGHLIFDTAENGYNHFIKDITAKLTGGSRYVTPESTLADLAKVYAEDPNWGNAVSQMSGISLGTKLKDIDINKLAPAIVKQEGFTGSITTPTPASITDFDKTSIPQYSNYLKTGKIGTNKDEMAQIKAEFGSIEEFKKQAESYNNSPGGPRQKELEKINKLKEDLDVLLSDEFKGARDDLTGLVATAASPWAALKRDDYLAKLKNFFDKKTLQTLIDVKQEGATFGALDRAELEMLQAAADEIAGVVDYDEKEVAMSEKGFNKALENLRNIYNERIEKQKKIMGQTIPEVTGGRITGTTGGRIK